MMEFLDWLREPPCSHLQLPTPFARVMEVEQSEGLKLHIRGCCNGNMRVDIEFPAPHVMLLRRGWKTFAHAHSLVQGHILHFKLMEDDLLSIKVFRCLGACLGCCVESSTDDESSSSSDSDEEDTGGEDDDIEPPVVKREGDDTEPS